MPGSAPIRGLRVLPLYCTHMLRCSDDSATVIDEQVSLILCGNMVVTFQKLSAMCLASRFVSGCGPAKAGSKRRGRLSGYALMDAVVDHLFCHP